MEERTVVTFANGARVVFDPMAHLNTASVGVYLGAGSRQEVADRSGLAHFLEHMAFKGAAGKNAFDLADAVEARGAVMNAATDYERTSYFVRCLAADAPDMLDIALSLVFAPDHPADEIKREKGVVLQEIGEAADQPDDLVFELAQQASFPGHALGRPILGTETTLKKVTREDLFSFAAASYAPQRTVVSVAGAFDRDAIEMVARRWLEKRTAQGWEPPPAPGETVAAVKTEERDLEQCHLVLARPGVSAMSDDRFATRLFVEIFGGGMASRLFQEVREKRGLAYTIDAAGDQYSDVGRTTVYAGCAPEDAGEVAKITADIWSDMAVNGATAAELARAKAVLKAQMAMSAEAPAARAGSAAYELLTFERLIGMDEVMQRIDAVTPQEVRAAAGVPGAATAAVVGPKRGLSAGETFARLSAAPLSAA